jgi:hypothetical protein
MKTLTFEQMENVQAGMPCWMALSLYGAAFIGLCAATGGIAVVSGLVTFGGSIYATIESCRYKLN